MSDGGGRGARRGFDGIDELLGYRIKNRDLLEEALTHASRTSGVGISYQRLEFLGDRVLGIAVAEMLYRRHPRDQEGALTKRYHSHVSGDALAKVAKRIGIAEYVRTQSKMNVERHDPVLGDVMESLIAAIYLDGGLEPARRFIERHVMGGHHQGRGAGGASGRGADPARKRDSKTELNELVLGMGLEPAVYELVGKSGPDHAPRVTCVVRVEGMKERKATENSKKKAEHLAAKRMLAAMDASQNTRSD